MEHCKVLCKCWVNVVSLYGLVAHSLSGAEVTGSSFNPMSIILFSLLILQLRCV